MATGVINSTPWEIIDNTDLQVNIITSTGLWALDLSISTDIKYARAPMKHPVSSKISSGSRRVLNGGPPLDQKHPIKMQNASYCRSRCCWSAILSNTIWWYNDHHVSFPRLLFSHSSIITFGYLYSISLCSWFLYSFCIWYTPYVIFTRLRTEFSTIGF
jgi:hypothetical protein